PPDSLKKIAPPQYRDAKAYGIWHVMPHWSADEAGVLIGDVLLAFNGGPTSDSLLGPDDYINMRVRTMKAGDTVRLTILRNGAVREMSIPLMAPKPVP